MRKGAAQVKKGEQRKPEPLDPPTAKLETRLELIASILESFLLGPGVSAWVPLNGALGPFSKVWDALGCAWMSQTARKLGVGKCGHRPAPAFATNWGSWMISGGATGGTSEFSRQCPEGISNPRSVLYSWGLVATVPGYKSRPKSDLNLYLGRRKGT